MKLLLSGRNNYKMKLVIDSSVLFFHNLRNFSLSGNLFFARKSYLFVLQRNAALIIMRTRTPQNLVPPASFHHFLLILTAHRAGLDLTDVEINLEIQYWIKSFVNNGF